METTNIIGQVGHSFDIILESMVGSTGYGWCLKSMAAGIELTSTDNMPVRTGIAPVRQVFTFAALKPVKNGIIEFDLLCLFDLTRESADHHDYTINIHDVNENDVLKNEIGGHKFIKGSGAMFHEKPIIPYGVIKPGKVIPLYGFPPESGLSTTMIHSQANCMLKYGNPFGVALEEAECTLKYGYPLMKYGYPPIYKYGFPLSGSAGEKFMIKENAANCSVKYGTPGGIAKNAEECVLKYGFPVKE